MENRNDKIFEALLKISAEEAFLQEVGALPSCDELDKLYKPSPTLNKKVRKIAYGYENTRKVRNILKVAEKVAAVFAVVLAISITALLSVEASRNYIFNIIINWREDHISFEFGDSGIELTFDKYTLNYLPEGFTFQTRHGSDNMRTTIYIDESGTQIILQQYLAQNSSDSFDNEDNKFSVISIHQSEAYLFESEESEGNNMLLWQDQDIAFKLISSIGSHELIQIAENIVKK